MLKDLLMFDPVTGRSGGKRKRTVVMITYATPRLKSPISCSKTRGNRSTHQICDPPHSIRQFKRPRSRKHLPAPQQVDGDRNAVRNPERHDGRRDNSVERAAGTQENASKNDDQNGGEVERV